MESRGISGWQMMILVLLRFAIGWHLFYQGFGKLISVNWTAEGYLKAGWGPFPMIAENPTLLWIADHVMIWSLMILGIMMMIGLFTRFAMVCGILLLGMIYVAIPPLDYSGFVYSTSEGAELYVNKLLIEILAMIVVASFRTDRVLGLDILIRYWRSR